jgi:glycosyltransferase involved in cell wall biosynthesis
LITIGMLAYNEAALIERTLKSLFAQTLLKAATQPAEEVELVVVANGCTDDTAGIARTALAALTRGGTAPHVHWRVEELQRPGKSHAWNRYVHAFADPRADHFFLMDADIEMLDGRTLESMVGLLRQRSDVWVAVDQPIKDTELEPEGGTWRRASARVGGLSGRRSEIGQPSWLCGQLYCIRGPVIRRLWLPDELTVCEDSLLYDFIVTDCLRGPVRPERVVLAPHAAHRFEAYKTLKAVLRHERWLIAGTIIKAIMLTDLRREMAEQGGDAASIIARRDAAEPGWLAALVDRSIANGGWWLVPNDIVFRRFQALRTKRWHQLPLLAPLAVGAFLADMAAALGANMDLQRRRPVAVSAR